MPVILDNGFAIPGPLHPRQDFEATGSIITTTGGTVQLGIATAGVTGALHGVSTVVVSLVGTGIAGAPTGVLEGTIDGSNWITVSLLTYGTLAQASTLSIPAIGGVYFAEVAAFRALRFRAITAPTGGSYAVSMRASNSDQLILSAPLPATLLAAPFAAASGTLTIAAAGAGLFHWITAIQIECHATATAIAAAATPTAITTTNLPSTMAFRTKTNIPAGEVAIIREDFANPIKSVTANTATTIVFPAVTNGQFFAKVYGYIAP